MNIQIRPPSPPHDPEIYVPFPICVESPIVERSPLKFHKTPLPQTQKSKRTRFSRIFGFMKRRKPDRNRKAISL